MVELFSLQSVITCTIILYSILVLQAQATHAHIRVRIHRHERLFVARLGMRCTYSDNPIGKQPCHAGECFQINSTYAICQTHLGGECGYDDIVGWDAWPCQQGSICNPINDISAYCQAPVGSQCNHITLKSEGSANDWPCITGSECVAVNETYSVCQPYNIPSTARESSSSSMDLWDSEDMDKSFSGSDDTSLSMEGSGSMSTSGSSNLNSFLYNPARLGGRCIDDTTEIECRVGECVRKNSTYGTCQTPIGGKCGYDEVTRPSEWPCMGGSECTSLNATYAECQSFELTGTD